MAKIRISADSTCDLSKDIIDKFDITIIPLSIIADGKSYKDGVEINSSDVFEITKKTGKLCSTSAVNVYDYSVKFKELLSDENDTLVHICISSDFSTCYRNACLAAEEFENRVRVIDSRNLSTGTGHIVYEAALMAENGYSLDEIESNMNELTSRVEASFVIDQLDYLKQGGRCNALQAFGASVLKLKPSISVIEGKMTVGETYRGSFEKCLKKYIKDKLDNRTDIVPDRCFITYSSAAPEIVSEIHKLVDSYCIFNEIIETTAGCTVSSHCGPNTLGILFIRKKKD